MAHPSIRPRSLRKGLAVGGLAIALLSFAGCAKSWVSEADPRALEFLENVRKVARHDDLTDINYIESRLGFKLKWQREDFALGYPNVDKKSTWLKSDSYWITEPTFPVRRPPKGQERQYSSSGSFQLRINRIGQNQGGYLLCFIAYDEPGACLSKADMEHLFGAADNAIQAADAPYTAYVYPFNGRNRGRVIVDIYEPMSCVSDISIVQNDPRQQSQ